MNDPYQSRRDFLKVLGAVAGVATVGLGVPLGGAYLTYMVDDPTYDFYGRINGKHVEFRRRHNPTLGGPLYVMVTGEGAKEATLYITNNHLQLAKAVKIKIPEGKIITIYHAIEEAQKRFGHNIFTKDESVTRLEQETFDSYRRRIEEQKKRAGIEKLV